MRAALRARRVINLANGSTLAGVGVAVLGGARPARSVDGLFVGTGDRLPVRAGLRRVSGSGRRAAAAGRALPWRASAARDGSTASPSR